MRMLVDNRAREVSRPDIPTAVPTSAGNATPVLYVKGECVPEEERRVLLGESLLVQLVAAANKISATDSRALARF